MNKLWYFVMPAVSILGTISNVFADAPAIVKNTSLKVGLLDVSFMKYLYYVFVFGLILAITYYVTQLIARKGNIKAKTKNMKVVETLPLGMEKSVVLVKVGKQYILLGSMPRNIVFLSNLDEDKLGIKENVGEADEFEVSFDSYLEDYENEDQDIHFNPIKKNLHRLKSMVRGTKSDE